MALTDFGFEQVSPAEKTRKVAAVFDSVAESYDIMNDFMSLGIHRLWKKFTISLANVRPGQKVLDLAGGSGDLSKAFSARVGKEGLVILSDINNAMLNVGRDNLINANCMRNVQCVQADAEQLPFPENYFDCVSIGFGLRNVTQKERALAAMYRVLKPGGQLLVLEFSKPTLPLVRAIYDKYSFSILPWLGDKIAKDRASYQYLSESIRRHPDQNTLREMILSAGFDQCDYFNLTAGIVAIHRAYKF